LAISGDTSIDTIRNVWKPRVTVSSRWQMTLPELTHFPVRTSFPPVAPQESTQPAGLFSVPVRAELAKAKLTQTRRARRPATEHFKRYRVGPADRPITLPKPRSIRRRGQGSLGNAPPGASALWASVFGYRGRNQLAWQQSIRALDHCLQLGCAFS
jgi:hypothetical protein